MPSQYFPNFEKALVTMFSFTLTLLLQIPIPFVRKWERLPGNTHSYISSTVFLETHIGRDSSLNHLLKYMIYEQKKGKQSHPPPNQNNPHLFCLTAFDDLMMNFIEPHLNDFHLHFLFLEKACVLSFWHS